MSYNELVSRYAVVQKIDMQGYQVDKKKGKDRIDASADPGQNETEQEINIIALCGQDPESDDVDC